MANKRQLLIITGGRPVSEGLLRKQFEESEYVIAADGGINALMKYHLTPDLIVGDFDSAPKLEWVKTYSEIPVVTFPKEKDCTDTELAILEAFKLPQETICIVGGIGSRMDHTLANMMLLQRIERAGKKGFIIDDHNQISVIETGSCIIQKKDWHFLSLVPLSEMLIVSMKGFKYPLDRASVDQISTVTISNEFIAQEGEIEIHSGRAFLMLTRD